MRTNQSRITVFQSRPFFLFCFLFPYFFSFPIGGRLFIREAFYFFEKFPPGEKPVGRLAPVLHALHFNSGGDVFKVDAGRGLVHVLPAVAGRTDEFLFDIFLKDAE